MFKFALVALLCAQAYAKPNSDINPFVVGGGKAKDGQFPYVVAIRHHKYYTVGGGALLSEKFVLTSAQCTDKYSASDLTIGVNSVILSFQVEHDVEKVIVHPKYNPNTMANDIALIKLKQPAKLSPKIKPIALSEDKDLVGKSVVELGWGRVLQNGPESGELKYLHGCKVIKNSECSKHLKIPILDSQICTSCEPETGLCDGDFGGPLSTEGSDGKPVLIGISSWIMPCARGYPEVFTKVSFYAKWIKENMV